VRDAVSHTTDEIFVSAGMTPLLTAQMMMLRRLGVDRIYYIRALYYTYYYLAEMLGIQADPTEY